jgi:hypothetical protein
MPSTEEDPTLWLNLALDLVSTLYPSSSPILTRAADAWKMHARSLHFTTWYSTLFASYIGYIHDFWWLLGIIHMFPSFIGLTWENQKTFFSMFLTFRDPNRVQITWNFVGASFSTEQDFREKEVQQRRSEEETSMAHVARCLGRMGPTRSHLVALTPSIFVLMDSSWPKTICKKGAPAGREREHRRNTETQNRSLGDRRSEGKNLAGRCRCDLHPLRWLYLHHHDEEGVVHL